MFNEHKEFFSTLQKIRKLVSEEISSSERYRTICSEVLSLYQPVMSSNFTGRVAISPINSNNHIMLLAYLSYFMSPILGFLIRLELEEIVLKRKRSEDLFFSLYNREVCELYFLTSIRFNERRLLGMFSRKNIQEYLGKFRCKLVFEPQPPVKEKIRHKGYRDKGTLADSSSVARRQEVQKELAFTLKQNDLESYDENIDLYLSCHKAWFESLQGSKEEEVKNSVTIKLTDC